MLPLQSCLQVLQNWQPVGQILEFYKKKDLSAVSKGTALYLSQVESQVSAWFLEAASM